MNLITIREYELNDKDEVLNLIRLNTPEYFAVDEEKDLKRYLENEIELYYVLIYDEKIVGCGGVNFTDDKTIGKISWDIIHPDYQGKSLGTKLLKHRIDKLHSIDSVQKITVRTSQVAYKFYEKQGFELFEIKKDYWADGFDMYNMEYKDSENRLNKTNVKLQNVVRTALRLFEQQENKATMLVNELKAGEKSGIISNFDREKALNKILHQSMDVEERTNK